jgi:hypothetical protein
VSLVAALDQIVTDLSDQTAAADGAARIGAQASGHLATGSVRSQLDELDATSVRTDVANVFAATQTMNGVADETVAAIATTAPPATRKLLWQIAGTNYGYRLYSTVRTLEFVLNARWDGGQWVKDSLAFASSKLELNNTELRVNSDDSLVSPFPDSWASSVALGVSAHGRQSFDAGANWLSAGPTDTYIGWRGATGTSSLVVGAGSPFRKQFPVVPSSITFSAISTQNISGPATATAVTTGGVGVLLNVTSLGLNTFFFITVFAS